MKTLLLKKLQKNMEELFHLLIINLKQNVISKKFLNNIFTIQKQIYL